MATLATLLLPAAAAFGGQRLDPATARALGRANRGAQKPSGRRAQLLRHFTLIPNHWPMAALMRRVDAGDAAGACWLRADPVHVRPDINGVRLMACGEALGLTERDSAALLPALKPLFGDAGFPIDAPTAAHWYLRLPLEAKLPAFTAPEDALGADLFDHLAEGSEGRRWRALMSEAQVVLHNHSWNAQRVSDGKLPINSLWIWGGGVLPDAVQTSHARVCSDDASAHALAHAACAAQPLPTGLELAVEEDVAFDLQQTRDLAQLDAEWLQPASTALRRGQLQRLELDFEDGKSLVLTRGQRWRFWRRPAQRLGP